MSAKTGTVYFATLPSGFFGNAGQSWESLDLEKITSLLFMLGISCEIVKVDELLSIDIQKKDTVIYTSSDLSSIRDYLKDVLYFIDKKCRLVPSYDFLLAHENKGFQELFKQENKLGNLSGFYHYDLDAYKGAYPFVYKKITGAGSSGVKLLRDPTDRSAVRKADFATKIWRRIITAQRKIKLNRQQFELYKYRHKGFNQYVCQEFIEGLDSDFKVLVFGKRLFVLKRYVRKNDFRASGSGNFEINPKPPLAVLQFAQEVYSKLEVPFASLDIAISNVGCHLIEFQVLNFGPIALTTSESHYVEINGEFNRQDGVCNLNEIYAEALGDYLVRPAGALS